MSRLPPLIHSMTLLLAIMASYLWVQTPSLIPYSLQAFSAAVLIYFLIKRLTRSRLHHIAPAPNSLEMPLMTFALLLLIGATGNLDSLLFPLSYLHLFFLVLSTQTIVAIVTALGLILYHLLLNPQMTMADWSNIVTIPILLILFLFTKHQHDDLAQAQARQAQINREKKLLEIHNQQQAKQLAEIDQTNNQTETDLVTLENFLDSFLHPKLKYMAELAENSDNYLVIRIQVELISKRVGEILAQIRPKQT